jgi:hypothetical protein
VEVVPYPKSNSLGVSHTPSTLLLSIMDFPQHHYRVADKNIESYNNAWESKVQKIKVHEKDPRVEIESSLNSMDSLQGFLLLEVWSVPSWASDEASTLASYLVVLPSYFHVHNLSVWNHL